MRQDPALVIHTLDESFERDMESTAEEEDVFELVGVMNKLAESGQLWGRVKKIKLMFGDTAKEWYVPEVSMDEMVKTANEWSPYGWKSMAKMIKGEI